jgi:hypothetical protein
MSNTYFSFIYDVPRQGMNTALIKDLVGTSVANSPNIEINAGSIIGLADMKGGNFKFFVTIPTAPTAGDSRQIGLYTARSNSGYFFDITGAVFSAKVVDELGNITSQTLTFDPSWVATETTFQVSRSAGVFTFSINGNVAAVLAPGDKVPKTPVSFYLANANADVMAFSGFSADTVENYI